MMMMRSPKYRAQHLTPFSVGFCSPVSRVEVDHVKTVLAQGLTDHLS